MERAYPIRRFGSSTYIGPFSFGFGLGLLAALRGLLDRQREGRAEIDPVVAFKALPDAGLVRSEQQGVEMLNTSRYAEIATRFPGLIQAIVAAYAARAQSSSSAVAISGAESERLMALIGYARVSTGGQDLDVQVAELIAAGTTVVHDEKVSGAITDRAALKRAVASARSGTFWL